MLQQQQHQQQQQQQQQQQVQPSSRNGVDPKMLSERLEGISKAQYVYSSPSVAAASDTSTPKVKVKVNESQLQYQCFTIIIVFSTFCIKHFTLSVIYEQYIFVYLQDYFSCVTHFVYFSCFL